MVQTRKQEESSGSGVKLSGRDSRASNRDSKGQTDEAEKDEEIDGKWSSSNHTRPQRTRRPNIRFEDISDPPRSRTRRVVYVEQADSSPSEDDTQSDDSIYQVSRGGRSRRMGRFRHARKAQQRLVNIRRASNGHSEVSMEEDNPAQEDDGIRRSTRQRKLTYDNLTTSWIMGTQTLRGYPSYRSQDGLPPPTDICQTRSVRARSREAAQEEEPAPTSSGQKQTSPVLRERRKIVKEEVKEGTNSGEENEEGAGDDQEAAGAEDKAASSADENKPDAEEETQQKRRSKQGLSTPINDGFADMYSRVKRTRRPTMRFSFSPNKSCSKNFSGRDGSESHSSSSDDEMEDGDSDHVQNEKRPRERGSVRTRKYQLRVIKPTVDRFQVQEVPVRRSSRALTKELCNTVLRRLGRRQPKRYGSASSSSSDSESRFEHKKAKSLAKARSRCMPLNYHPKDSPQVTGHHTIRSKDGKTANLADVGPMALDTTIRFSHVGGLEDHIRCLQEMVVFPMLYKEIFEKFNITAPKGVLFHGPPGTGKTLIARALANECSQGEHKVTFFMRKGADCLSKWVGESERQLRLLFEQAHQMRPSIIFFDEIDGLAPVRSSKQDQIHASIVSTLLALMDGLDNRGDVIVIGATNRIDAIDPALRRPGRFDRELYFPLPASKERQEILRIHMNKWDQAPSQDLLDDLAERAGGYCGSDLRALCAESVVQALRRTYPQIYKSSQKLLLDSDRVQVSRDDFAKAQAGIVPAAHRVCPNVARKLKPFLEPILGSAVTKVLKQLLEIFPHGLKKEIDPWVIVNRPRLLLTGIGPEFAQTSHVAPAILYHMEHVRVHVLDLTTLYEVSARSPEEAVIQVFQEARRNPPAVIYTPSIGQWWDMIPVTVQSVFLLQLRKLDQNSPVLLLSTSDSAYSELPEQLCDLFSRYRDEVFTMSYPDDSERKRFFTPLFLEKTTAPPPPPKPADEDLEALPLAPPPEPAKLTEDELGKLYQDEEVTLRELRIFLREVCAKLARNRQFFMFTKPVDITEVPDYLEIIEKPMDLETMMTKIDQHHYECAKDFLDDVDLICRNALEYNPDRDPADKLIRHRACFLRDSAYALIKAEMDSDFEVKCKRISQSRKKRGGSPSRFAPAPDFIHTMNSAPPAQPNKAQQSSKTQSNRSSNQLVNGDVSSHSSLASMGTTPNPSLSASKKRKKSTWYKGFITKKKKRCNPPNEESPSVAEKQKASDAVNDDDKDTKASSSKDQSDDPSQSSSLDKENLDESKMSVDEKSSPESSNSPKNVLVNGDMEAIEEEAESNPSSERKSESKENDNDEPVSPKANDSADSKLDLKTAVSDSEEMPVSSAETSNRRTRSVDSRKSSTGSQAPLNTVLVDRVALEKLLDESVKATSSCPAEVVVEVYTRLNKSVQKYLTVWDRHSLPQELEQEIERFKAHRETDHQH